MSDAVWVLLQQAEEYMKNGRRESAIPLLAGHLQKSPDSVRAWWLLSLAVSNPTQQIDCLERILKIDPDYSPARTRLEMLRAVSNPPAFIPPFSTPLDAQPNEILGEDAKPGQKIPVASKEVPRKTPNPSKPRQTTNQTLQFAVLGGMFLFALAVLGLGGVLLLQGFASPGASALEPSAVTQIMLPPTWTPTNAPTLAPTSTAVPMTTSLPVSPTVDMLQTSIAKSLIGPNVGYFAPDFSLPNVDTGSTVKLSSYTGSPVLLFFWTTWCPYCEAEVPILETIYDNYHADGLEILAVDVDENATLARQYKLSHTMKYVILDDHSSLVANRYNVTSYPRLIFIEPSGKISYIGIGLTDYLKLEAEVKEIIGISQ